MESAWNCTFGVRSSCAKYRQSWIYQKCLKKIVENNFFCKIITKTYHFNCSETFCTENYLKIINKTICISCAFTLNWIILTCVTFNDEARPFPWFRVKKLSIELQCNMEFAVCINPFSVAICENEREWDVNISYSLCSH